VPIKYEDVTFTYLHYNKPALADINLHIKDGSITALLGPVGAGKSTLLHMMNGLVPNHFPGYMDGKVTVDEIEVAKVEVQEVAKRLNMVFDDPVLQIVSLTVKDDIAFGPANLALPREEVIARVSDALERTRLVGYETRNPRTLSGGEQQLLAIAGVLAMQPKYLVLDEPVALLDPIGKKQVFDAIRKLCKESNVTVVIAESGADVESLMEFVDHIVLISKGKIITEGEPVEVLADKGLIEEIGLRVPQVTEIAYHLSNGKSKSVPITLDQGMAFVFDKVKKFFFFFKTVKEKRKKDKEENAVILRDVCHTYPGPPPVEALKGVSLEINKGEMVALLGQNGSGKTTLAFHLVGALKPTNEEAYIEVAGLDVRNTPQFDLIKRANYVFQNPANQLFNETFEKEVKYGPEKLGFSPEETEERAKEALKLVGLGHLWEQSTFNIPKSYETLLGLASILSLSPQVLIVDEPTGGLDLKTSRKVMETLKKINEEQNCTIIMITHDMALASKYSKRVIVLQSGNILLDGATKEVFAQPETLKKAMLSPPQITLLGQRLSDLGYPPDILTVDEFIHIIS